MSPESVSNRLSPLFLLFALGGESFARVGVAHPGPVAAHDRVAEEGNAQNILAAVDQVPPVPSGPDIRG
jgi:hypothetical protein